MFKIKLAENSGEWLVTFTIHFNSTVVTLNQTIDIGVSHLAFTWSPLSGPRLYENAILLPSYVTITSLNVTGIPQQARRFFVTFPELSNVTRFYELTLWANEMTSEQVDEEYEGTLHQSLSARFCNYN